MKQRRRIYYSSAQRSEIWDHWQAGESPLLLDTEIERAADRPTANRLATGEQTYREAPVFVTRADRHHATPP